MLKRLLPLMIVSLMVIGVRCSPVQAKSSDLCSSNSDLVRFLKQMKAGARHFEVVTQRNKSQEQVQVFMAGGDVYVSGEQGLSSRLATVGSLQFFEEKVAGSTRWKVQKALPNERQRRFLSVAQQFFAGCSDTREIHGGFEAQFRTAQSGQPQKISIVANKKDRVPWKIPNDKVCSIPGFDTGNVKFPACQNTGLATESK